MMPITLITYTKAFLLLLLALLAAACTIKNTTVAGEQATLKDTDWMLLSVGDQEVSAEKNTRTSYIHFEKENNKVKGFASCNSFFGRYTLADDKLTLSNLGSTRMTCPDMALETKLLQALEKVTAYSISGQILTLYENKNAIASFRAGYGQPGHQEPGR